jgi:hypothetical protein
LASTSRRSSMPPFCDASSSQLWSRRLRTMSRPHPT